MSWERAFKADLARRLAAAGQPCPDSLASAVFAPEYRATTPPGLAARDALRLAALDRDGGEGFDLWEPDPDLGGCHQLRLYSGRERGLDEIMPLVQSLGFRVLDQSSFRLELGTRRWCLRGFAVRPQAPGVDPLAYKAQVLEALDALLAGRVDNDALNGLLLSAGLSWREIDVFRAYRNYYFQLGSHFGRFRFHQALLAHPGVARLLFRYFAARFEPDGRWDTPGQREEEALSPLRQELATLLDGVADSAEDRILRDVFNLVDATLRTDYYLPKAPDQHAIAFKINSLGIINMPAPRPLFEIYVHSRLMEGIHLRGAKVARGGIRWSDRPDDFRSEILGLMRTQMIKNALIVPLGAKGGFVLNSTEPRPEERERLAQTAYATLMRGLLDLTDNPTVEPPHRRIAYDAADPYLVVAADKGTARMSDTANRIAAEYGFWLGDAFASGGSQGFHHKKLGITARGAWECVKRHFREAGLALDRPFSVVGIGSMDGDVFGNGMLLSENIRLLAAFGSHEIFLDPDPDPAVSFRERLRLFELAAPGWEAYDRALISPGGGVFPRDAKDIPLSPAVRAWLGLRHASVDGEELIRLLLAAPVDLLWLGGIGTYVKAGSERHESVADRANDAVRIDAVQVRAKVVGEGANLGFTQKARIEYALAGGRINTDAVDNSGGVDLSDHEVNLKMLLALLRRRGLIDGVEERNRRLADLSGAVVGSVLAHNAAQSLCLSLDRQRCALDAEPFLDVADRLANAGLLDRAVEDFPARKDILARGGGLTRPELAVLMAYAKLALKRALLDRPDFPGEWTQDCLSAYFPGPLREEFGAYLPEHPLAREITVTQIANAVIDQAGVGFLAWVEELDSTLLARAVEAYARFDRIVGGRALREQIHKLDGSWAIDRQYLGLLRLEGLLAELCRRSLDRNPIPAFAAGRGGLRDYLDYLAADTTATGTLAELTAAGFTQEQACLLVHAERLGQFPALLEWAGAQGLALAEVARLSDTIAAQLGLPRLIAWLAAVQPRDRWERRARLALIDRFQTAPARLGAYLSRQGIQEPAALSATPALQTRLAHFQRLARELTDAAATSVAPFAALGAALEALREAGDGEAQSERAITVPKA